MPPDNMNLVLLIVHQLDQENVNQDEMKCKACGQMIVGEDEIIDQIDRAIEMDFVERNKGKHRYISCKDVKEIPLSTLEQQSVEPQSVEQQLTDLEKITEDLLEPIEKLVEQTEELQLQLQLTLNQKLIEFKEDLNSTIMNLNNTGELSNVGKLILEASIDWLDKIIGEKQC